MMDLVFDRWRMQMSDASDRRLFLRWQFRVCSSAPQTVRSRTLSLALLTLLLNTHIHQSSLPARNACCRPPAAWTWTPWNQERPAPFSRPARRHWALGRSATAASSVCSAPPTSPPQEAIHHFHFNTAFSFFYMFAHWNSFSLLPPSSILACQAVHHAAQPTLSTTPRPTSRSAP